MSHMGKIACDTACDRGKVHCILFMVCFMNGESIPLQADLFIWRQESEADKSGAKEDIVSPYWLS
jgi:hypothetical protein